MSWSPGEEGLNWNLPVHGLELPNEPWPAEEIEDQNFIRGVSVDRYVGRSTTADQGERSR